MDTQYLYEFQELAKDLNFTAAAKALNMTQPTLSNHLKALEHDMGAVLVERSLHAGTVRLTAAGQTFFDYAGRLTHLLGEMEHDVKITGQHTSSRLVVQLPREAYRNPLMQLLAGFRETCPGVELSILPWRGPRDTDATLGDGVDCLCEVTFDGGSDRSSTLLPIASYGICALIDTSILLAARDRLVPAHLGSYRIALPLCERESTWRDNVERFVAAYGLACTIVDLCCDSIEDFVLNRLSTDEIVLCDASLAQTVLAPLCPQRVVRNLDGVAPARLNLAYLPNNPNEALAAFVDYVRRADPTDVAAAHAAGETPVTARRLA